MVSSTKRGTFFGFEGNGPVNGRSEVVTRTVLRSQCTLCRRPPTGIDTGSSGRAGLWCNFCTRKPELRFLAVEGAGQPQQDDILVLWWQEVSRHLSSITAGRSHCGRGERLVPDAYSQLVTHRPFARPETVRTLLNLPRSGKNGLSISPRLHLSQASGWDKTTRQTPITWIRKVSENCLKPPYPPIEGAFGQMGPLHLKNLSHWRKASAPPMISVF